MGTSAGGCMGIRFGSTWSSKAKSPPEKGYLIDYGDIKQVAEPIVKRLDHYYLNEIGPGESDQRESSPNGSGIEFKPALPLLAAIIVYETCTSTCEYRGI